MLVRASCVVVVEMYATTIETMEEEEERKHTAQAGKPGMD